MGLLDFFFPKYCVSCKKFGSYLCVNCFSYISFEDSYLCLVCNRASFDGLTHPGCKTRYTIDGAFSSISYKGVVKKLLYAFKYKPYLSDLNHILGDLFYEGIIQHEQFQKALELGPVLVPIPLHSSRLKQRGYNHAELLAKGLSQRLNLPVQNILKRTRKTQSQYGLKKKERIKNLAGAFAVQSDKQKEIRDKYIFLVDDILTTGSTLLETAKVLKKSGAEKVFGITLARD